MKKITAWVLGSWFGSGMFPWASGTVGTAATLPLVAVVGLYLPAWQWWSPWCLILAVILFLPGVWAAFYIEKNTGKHDPSVVVIDEVCGTLVTFAFLDAEAFGHIGVYVAGFFLFRIFDVWKPGWINSSQKLPGGWGVMVDDILAGFMAGIVLIVLRHNWSEVLFWGF
jgi:phosphatidylglycerophosphatase A